MTAPGEPHGDSRQEGERELRRLTDDLPVLISYVDASRRYRFVNAAYETWFGHTRAEMEGEHMRVVLGEAAYAALESEIDRVLRGEHVAFDSRIPYKDGGPRDVHVEYVPRVEHGEVTGFYVLVQDVGERRKTEAALKQSAERFRAAVDAVHGVVWTNNPEGRMEGDQPGWSALTGQSKADYQGFGWAQAVHPEDAQATVEAWNAAVAERRPFAFEHRVRRHDGKWRRFSIRAIPVLDDNGEVNEWVGIHTDVTEDRAAAAGAAALVELSERIRQIEDADDLAYAASEILGHTLNVSRVGYGTIDKASETITIERDWNAPGIKSLTGTLHFRDYGSYIEELKRGETVVFADAAKDSRTSATLKALQGINAVSLVNMPVTEQGGLVALLYLNNDTPREWNPDELSLIREVADRTRTAVERRRAEVDLKANEARLRFLDGLANETGKSGDADAILSVTTRMLGSHLGIDVCAYADLEPDEDIFTIRGDWSAPGAATIVGRYSLADFGTLAVERLRAGEPLVINNNIAELGEQESSEFLRIGLRSTICMPFIKEGRLTALMAVHCTKPHRWTPNELALVQEVTARSWAHIERVRSQAALRESEGRQALLLQLSDTLRPMDNPADILLTASRMLGEKLNANRVAYSEDQGDGETIVVTRNYVNGVPGIEGRHRYADFGFTVLAELQTGRTVARADIANDPALTDTAKAARAALQIGAQINVPLVKEGRLLAVLGVHYRERHDFTIDEIALVEAVAERTWAAVERSRAESAVRQRADEMQAVFEAVPAAIWIARDAEGRRIDGNAFARKLLRLEEGGNMSLSAGRQEAPRGFRVLSVDGTELKPEELPVQRAARGELVRNFEEQIVFEDGLSVHLVGNAQPILGEDGVPRGSVASFVDISARKAAEAAVRESEQRFRNMADHAPVMMWVTDPTGYCTYLNRSWYEFTGQTREEAEGFGWLEATHPDDKAEAEHSFLEANAAHSPFRVEYRLRRADGAYRWCIDAASPRFGADGEFLGYVGSVIDIEQRRAAELQLRGINDILEGRISSALEERAKAEEGLRQAQKLEAIGQLTGGVAHDFNNLLMIVQAGLNMLERKEDKTHRDMLISRMREAVTRGANLTRQLLAFSRRGELAPEAVDFDDMIQGMAELLDRSLGARVQVKLDIAADLASIYVDPNALQLAILNLAVNARDAMPKGGAITVRAANGTASDPRAACVSISVIDTGEGIPADVRARIFEPFFTTKEIGKGSGLGLAQVHGFAQQSGGHIEVESAPGKGTTMTLVLPHSETAANPILKPRLTFRAARATGDAGHVLLVEDDNEVAALTGEMLEHLGWRVTRAASAEAALGALANDRNVDLVFSDVMMPGRMNGLELARETRKRRPSLPVVLTSGYAEAVRRDAEQAGVPLLPKPFNLDTLAAVLEVARMN